MKYTTVIGACLIIMLCAYESRYYSSVIVKTSKSKMEIVAALCGIAALVIIIFFYAQYWVHYLLSAFGILIIIADVWKQGLSKEGLLIVTRGKELYKWEEIHHAEIKISDEIKITYFSNMNSTIVSHHYRISDYDKILELFQTNHICVIEG